MANIYEELNMKTFINAAGTYTIVGGSKMSTKTLGDIASASSRFVTIRDLQKRVHERIAEMTNNEAAYVSSGAAAGLYLAIAAAIQLKNGNSRYYYLDKGTVEKYNIVVFKSHRNPYDLVIGDLGAQYKEIGFPNIIFPATSEDLDEAIDEKTAAIYFAQATWTAPGAMSLDKVVSVANKREIPVIVDAAAQLPPLENLWKFNQMGATVTLFSGGKDLRGPQSSGLMVGKKAFLDVVTSLGFPNYGIGRMLKVGREELIGLYSAVKQYVELDHQKRLEWCEEQVAKVLAAFKDSSMFHACRCFPNEAGQPIPRAHVEVISSNITPEQVCKMLFDNSNPIYAVSDGTNGVYVNPMTLDEGEAEIVIQALKAIVAERN